MEKRHLEIISKSLSVKPVQIANTVKLLAEGATIPFISRYRKEVTGSLDEVQIKAIRDLLNKLVEIDKRRESIIKSIHEQGKLTSELREKLNNADSITELEDLYLPYKPKRKTRASEARQKGLEPLAKIIFEQKETNILQTAKEFINEKVPAIEDALQGACDIIAEWISEDRKARDVVRRLFGREAQIISMVDKGKIEDAVKYKDYFDYTEPLNKCVSHRLLAMRRGENEGFLKLTVKPDEDKAIEALAGLFVKSSSETSDYVMKSVKDSYKRLLGPSIENEFRAGSKATADKEAIKVFAGNLSQLLMASPLGEKRVLAIDPGYRTGCKIVCLDEQGNLLHNETIYPNAPQKETKQAAKKITTLASQYKIQAIAIGNGTASRETEVFIKKLKFSTDLQVFVVNEAGASVYSASSVGREEFPGYDVTVRGAVSIGRRLMDPLAELVKIEPKSIGVGQYQHDVDQAWLKESLDQVVESCVNNVGVNLNTASKYLLTYISGLGPGLAQNIIDYRKDKGPFKDREELKNIPLMGSRAFQQSAGFLRIRNGKNPLDNTSIHPESYYIINKMAEKSGITVEELIENEDQRKKIDIKEYIDEKTGVPTLKDIINELVRPGRDPRSKIKMFEFARDINSINDLKTGMILPGIVTNITNFGAFVDVGVKQDGLVHISQIADRYVGNPAEIVNLNQQVKVKVLDVDVERKRIQLSMKGISDTENK
ncbi:MAG: RNA-binding transcriptional accessory protein [Bacteroidales bacterium]|nr:MAG: RNA-binding transcriptional accessory protein [Bacteroidales bacterium]